MSEDLHSGHRQRLRERFLRDGLDSLEDHTALELLLCYAIPRKDVNGLAHELLNRFGSLSAVLDADQAALEQVPGMGENAAALLRLIPAMNRRYLIDRGRAGRSSLCGIPPRRGSSSCPISTGCGRNGSTWPFWMSTAACSPARRYSRAASGTLR